MKEYYRHQIKNLLSVKSIMTIEYLELAPSYSHTSEQHDFWELVYVDKGQITYFIEETPLNLGEGHIIFLAPNQKHSILSNGKTSPCIFVLCFQCPSQIMNIFSNYIAKVTSTAKGFLQSIINETHDTFKMPFNTFLEPLEKPNLGGEQAIKLYLELLLIYLLRQGSKEKTLPQVILSEENFPKELTSSVIKYLKAHVSYNVTIEQICESVSYSKTYLSKIFKKISGKSIIVYFNELKIDEAKRLLRETSHSMTEISDKLGFSDPRYFHSLFKKISQVTPKQYRNSIKKFD